MLLLYVGALRSQEGCEYKLASLSMCTSRRGPRLSSDDVTTVSNVEQVILVFYRSWALLP